MKKTFKELDDKKFYLEIPDPDFSPARNKAVIAETIRKQNEYIKKKKFEHRGAYLERADAVVSYLKHNQGKPGYALDRYFDKKYITYLRGDDIRRELMANMQIFDKNNKRLIIN